MKLLRTTGRVLFILAILGIIGYTYHQTVIQGNFSVENFQEPPETTTQEL